VIALYDVFYLQKTIFLALEYMPYELSAIIKDTSVMLREEHVKNIAMQVLRAVEFLHSNFIMHRVFKNCLSL